MANNVFNNDGDSVGTMLVIPSWADTSAPMRLQAVLSSAVTGTLQMKAWLNRSVDGDTISTSDPTSTAGESSDTVSKSVTAGQQITYEFDLDISQYGAEGSGTAEVLWVNLESVSRPGDIRGMTFDLKFLKWRDGAHL